MKSRYGMVAFIVASQLLTLPVYAAGPGGPGGARGVASQATLVETTTVAEHELHQTLNLVGKLEASQSVVIAPESAGRVDKILVQNNQQVAENEVLVVLDTAMAEMNVEEAKLTLAEEQRILGEYERLAEKKAITQTSIAGQRAKVQIAEVKLASAQHDLEELYIKAPFSGTTGFINFSRGKMVSTATELLTIDDLSVMYVDVSVPEKYMQQLSGGGLKATATSQAWPGVEFTGTLKAVDTRVNPDSLNMTARIEFTNSDTQLKPGMLMTVGLEFAPVFEPIVPLQSIEYSGSKRYVYLVGDDNKAMRTEVSLGSSYDEQVVVTDGLDIGDRVVVRGTVKLRDGSLITDQNDTPKGPMISDGRDALEKGAAEQGVAVKGDS
jgi:RND family efflux transporter MFP subunit